MYPDLKLFIGGAWRKTKQDMPVLNPATEEEIGRLPCAGSGDLDDAVEAAEQCGVIAVPEVLESRPLKDLLAGWTKSDPSRRLLFCDEGEESQNPLGELARLAKTGPQPLAILIGLIPAVLIGLANGFGVAVCRVHPLIMTLGTGLIGTGCLQVYQRFVIATGSSSASERKRRTRATKSSTSSSEKALSRLIMRTSCVTLLSGEVVAVWPTLRLGESSRTRCGNVASRAALRRTSASYS